MAGHAASTEHERRQGRGRAAVRSRDWTDDDAVRAQLERAVGRFGAERLVVIAGGACGADRQAEACARELGLAVGVYLARWDRHGRSAGYRRNVQMLDRLADFPHRYLIAFSIVSRGTQHTIDPGASARHSRPGCRPRSSTTLTRSARTRPSMRDNTRAPAPMSPRRARELQR
jgi:YspA, cpYpsA-related SLOG family